MAIASHQFITTPMQLLEGGTDLINKFTTLVQVLEREGLVDTANRFHESTYG